MYVCCSSCTEHELSPTTLFQCTKAVMGKRNPTPLDKAACVDIINKDGLFGLDGYPGTYVCM